MCVRGHLKYAVVNFRHLVATAKWPTAETTAKKINKNKYLSIVVTSSLNHLTQHTLKAWVLNTSYLFMYECIWVCMCIYAHIYVCIHIYEYIYYTWEVYRKKTIYYRSDYCVSRYECVCMCECACVWKCLYALRSTA